MIRKATLALCGALATFSGANGHADIWASQFQVLERLDTEGDVVDAVTEAFGQPFRAGLPYEGILEAEVDVRDGSLVVVDLGPRDDQPRMGRIIKLSQTGEGIWQQPFTGDRHAIDIDIGRHGVWVARRLQEPGGSSEMEVVLLDDPTGEVVSTVDVGTANVFNIEVGADGALWVQDTRTGGLIRIEGSPQELDGYEAVGDVGRHHERIDGFASISLYAVDRADGSLWAGDSVPNPPLDEPDAFVVKLSPEGEELFRVRHHLWNFFSDMAVDPRDGSVYVTHSFFGGSISHVSALGGDLGRVPYPEYVGDVVVDTEDFGIWISHMPRVDDDEALIAPMVLRKLDADMQTVLEVPYPTPTHVTIAGVVPGPGEISIDIQPQNKRNVVDIEDGKGELRVALLSSGDFDPLQVDMDTIRFGTAGAVVRRHRTRDVNKDGVTDLIVTFETRDTGIKCGDTQAPLTAQTFGGLSVNGADAIRTKCEPRRSAQVVAS